LPYLLTSGPIGSGPIGVGVSTLLSSQDVKLKRTIADILEAGDNNVAACSAGLVADELPEGWNSSLAMEEGVGVAVETTLGVWVE
jgi:hypothetical protein